MCQRTKPQPSDNMANDFETVRKMLDKAGYEEVGSDTVDGDANKLGHKEFFMATTPKYTILALGPGRVGETGSFTNLMFTNGTGEFIEHASIYEEVEDE